MRTSTVAAVAVVLCVALAGPADAALRSRPDSRRSTPTSAQGTAPRIDDTVPQPIRVVTPRNVMTKLRPDTVRPFSSKMPLRRVREDGSRTGLGTPQCGGQNVYANLAGEVFFVPGSGVRIADDIQTTCAAGGNLTCLELVLYGGGDGSGPGFSATVELWDGCPGDGGVLIPGSTQVFGSDELVDDGAWIVPLEPDPPLALTSTFWIAVQFDSNDAGWVFGAPTTLGASDDTFYMDDPEIGCIGWFGGCNNGSGNPCANFYADVYVESCETQHIGYQSSDFSGLFYGGQANELSADDITPTNPNCQLVRLELDYGGATTGDTPAPYTAHIGILGDGNGTPPAPDSAVVLVDGLTFNGAGNGFVETAVFNFTPAIDLPSTFWVTNMDDSGDAGPIIAGAAPQAGSSGDFYAVQNGAAWELLFFGGCGPNDDDPCGSFNMRLFCAGEAPTGACCAAGACVEGITVQNCAGRFAVGATCAAAAFDPPCGVTACCTTDGGCADLDAAACSAAQGLREATAFCADTGFACPAGGCIGATGSCSIEHATPGCDDAACCAAVCDIDPFCCNTSWDSSCINTAGGETVCSVSPENDACAGALPVTAGETAFATLTATTDGPNLPIACEEGTGLILGSDLWFDYIAPGCGMVTAGTCDDADFDTRMAVYSGCDCPVDNDRLVACNDDSDDCMGFTSSLTFDVTAGNCYKVRVGGWNDDFGSGTLSVTESFETCPENCVAASIAFIDPPDGIVDARQPHELQDASALLGIDRLTVSADADVTDLLCWSLCETADTGTPNGIRLVNDNGDGTYLVVLDRALTPGAVTTVTHLASAATITLTTHPGNVDGDTIAGPLDILAIIDILNGIDTAVHGLYSADIDHSGLIAPVDILGVIDLLNGAGAFDAWNNVPLPDPAPCVP